MRQWADDYKVFSRLEKFLMQQRQSPYRSVNFAVMRLATDALENFRPDSQLESGKEDKRDNHDYQGYNQAGKEDNLEKDAAHRHEGDEEDK